MSKAKKVAASGFGYIVMGLALGAILFAISIGGMIILLRGF